MHKSHQSPTLHVVQEGSGPLLVLSHALGCNLGMWDEVTPLLSKQFTVVRYDHRNHGSSESSSQPFSVDDLADDVAKVIEGLSNKPVYFVGLSLGGMVAQSLVARYPHLIKASVIANSAQFYDDSAKKMWADRIDKVLKEGLSSISGMAIERWFTPEFLGAMDQSNQRRIAGVRSDLDLCDADLYALSCAAVSDIDFRKSNETINLPTLVLFGLKDQATPPALSFAIHEAIKGSVLAEIDAAHLSAVELPVQFAEIVSSFLKSH